MTGVEGPELRPAYRTLNEPTRLLGLSLGGWAVVLVAGGAGYGWLLVSPLPWRANMSLAAIVLGLPAALMVLREQSTITPARLLRAVVRWRVRPAALIALDRELPVRRGAVRLDDVPPSGAEFEPRADRGELPWLAEHTDETGAEGTPR
jgi:hypothetical protein